MLNSPERLTCSRVLADGFARSRCCSRSAGARASTLWQINESYSNADGSVQFIELITTSSGQQFVTGDAMTSSQGATTYTFNVTTDLEPVELDVLA